MLSLYKIFDTKLIAVITLQFKHRQVVQKVKKEKSPIIVMPSLHVYTNIKSEFSLFSPVCSDMCSVVQPNLSNLIKQIFHHS